VSVSASGKRAQQARGGRSGSGGVRRRPRVERSTSEVASAHPGNELALPPAWVGAGADTREPIRIRPRLVAASAVAALVMIPVTVLLTGLGILALKVSGGADADTSRVVLVAAAAVSDFWAGGLLFAFTREPRREIAVTWGAVRAVLLLAGMALLPKIVVVAPIMLVLAVPAAMVGVRVSAVQARLKREAVQEREELRRRARAERDATGPSAAAVR
jgi:hypothetical protein